MKNLRPYDDHNSFDIGIHHRGTYFDVDKTVEKDKILIHSPLFGPHKTPIIPLFDGASLCYCRIDAENPISILQNPTSPDIITLTFIMEGFIHFGRSSKSGKRILSGTAFLDHSNLDPSYNSIPEKIQLLSIDLHLSHHFYSMHLHQMVKSGGLSPKLEKLLMSPDSFQATIATISFDIHHLFIKILNAPYRGKQLSFYRKIKVMEILFHYFSRLQESLDISDKNRKTSTSRDIRDRLFYLKELMNSNKYHFRDLNEITKEIGMSESTLQREFKRLFGFSVMQYYKKCLLRRGYRMLEEGGNVKQTAYDIGYSSTAAFSKAFYKEYGFRPSSVLE